MRPCCIMLLLIALCSPLVYADSPAEKSAQALLHRLLPEHVAAFSFESIPQEEGKDVFEVESRDGLVILRGNTGVAMASALNHYLNHYCHASVSLQGRQLRLPSPLPVLKEKVRIVSPFQYRYCFNYCCFSYSMAWWDWEMWERCIDWMALHGINMPLAVTGQESTWRNVYRDLGLSDKEIGDFIVGPAYLPFGWMGCMDGWGGPLPKSWIDGHEALQKKILARERALGMKPVLQGFTGHVPEGLQRIFPEAKFEALPDWAQFPHTWFLNPQDPLFAEIGKRFIREQERQFGTDHLYAADTFIEMPPPDNDPAFLDKMAKAVHGGMTAADPKAIWVMQGWLFVHAKHFWKAPQTKALLSAVPDDRMIVLDLYCEKVPTWNTTKAFYGKPWLWCIIQSFGDQVSLHGALPQIYAGLNQALQDPERGALAGAGMIMEGLGYNPIVHDLMGDLFWQPEQGGIAAWVKAYPARRYGATHADAQQAWKILLETAYEKPGQMNSMVANRPRLGDGGPFTHYAEEKLVEAWELLLGCAASFKEVDAYHYDIVHLTRQVLLNKLQRLRPNIDSGYYAKDTAYFEKYVGKFTELIQDIDRLLATRREFLLGKWLEDAKSWATTEDERRLYEWNARNQITLWGDKNSPLHYYANKQWAGMLKGYYLKRWELFFDAMRASMQNDHALKIPHYQDWEEAWTHQTESYPDSPKGDALTIAQALHEKYRNTLFAAEDELPVEALSLTTGKESTCSFALPGHPASLANDGMFSNTHHYWATDTQQDEATWWQVDLGEEKEVGRIVVITFFGYERSYGFTVEVSSDQRSWKSVADYSETYEKASLQGTTVRFSSQPLRYIRITFNHSTANSGRHLVEVMAYEE